MFTIEPGGGRRSAARAWVTAILPAAWAGEAMGAVGWAEVAATAGVGLPARAASKKAFWADMRVSLRPGLRSVCAGGQTGGRIGTTMATRMTSLREHG